MDGWIKGRRKKGVDGGVNDWVDGYMNESLSE